MTRIERLLGAPAGTEVDLAVDLIVTDDWTTPALIPPLEALGTSRAAAPVLLVRDHTQPPESYERDEDRARVRSLRDTEESFVNRFGAATIRGQGIQHHVVPSSGHLRPGMIVLGNDSHTPTLGAYGVAAFAAQPTTIAAAIHTGRLVMRVPETLEIRLVGRLQPGSSARDAALTLLDLLRAGGNVPRLATGKALEFSGPGLMTLSSAERSTLANTTPEAVAVTATFPVDRPTLEALGLESGSEEVEQADLGSSPRDDGTAFILLDLSEVVPKVARSGQPTDVTRLDELDELRVDRVFVGTCASGTFEEISDFAEALGPQALVPTIVAPASTAIEGRLREGGILQRLESAGVTLLPPGCGPCFGFGIGRLAEGEVAVVTGNRNGIGRMGSATARIYLASGRSAGIAARTARIGSTSNEAHWSAPPERPRVVWPAGGNVVRLLGTVSTDDLTPSAVPGIGTSNDADPAVLRRLLLHHLDPSAAERDLQGTILVADHNFGVGSNRASSIRALMIAGVRAVIARSVSPLYAMGARDEGFNLIELDDDGFFALIDRDTIVEVDRGLGEVRVGSERFPIAAATPFEQGLAAAGGVVRYLLRAS